VVSATLTETAAASEALSAAAQLVAAVAEAGSAADAYAAAHQMVALITEPAAAADAVSSAVVATYSVSLTELVTALDQIAAALAGDGTFDGDVFRITKGASTSRVVAGASTSRVVAGTARQPIRGYQ
jgi:hypothetical protein